MGLPADGRVIAFGDFDGDQLYVLLRCSGQYTDYTSRLDVLVLSTDQQTLSVHYWDHGMSYPCGHYMVSDLLR